MGVRKAYVNGKQPKEQLWVIKLHMQYKQGFPWEKQNKRGIHTFATYGVTWSNALTIWEIPLYSAEI